MPGMDRPLRRSRRRWLSGISNAVPPGLREYGMERCLGLRHVSGRYCSEGPESAVRTARVYIRRVDADGRRLSTLQAAGAGVSPPQKSRQLATEIRRALLVRRYGILCLRAGWREEAGTDDRVQSRPLVVERNRESRACGQSHRAPARTRY